MPETRPPAWFPWPREGLWRHSDFLKFWSAQAVSALGSRITRTALPILAVLTIGASAEQVAVLAALSLAPGSVGRPFSRRMDRSPCETSTIDRRRSDSCRAASGHSAFPRGWAV